MPALPLLLYLPSWPRSMSDPVPAFFKNPVSKLPVFSVRIY
jgi:hypothetical protein